MALKAKRILDILGALAALAVAGPAMALIAVAILLCDGRPVFWSQERSGRAGRTFRLFKFRTMSGATDGHGRLLDDRSRLTSLGAVLRQWSLDELPQLWNVLKNDMSLAGPRPLVPSYALRYNAVQRHRLDVQPGLTGWAQVSGRNALTWDAKFALDIWYVTHWSLWLDLKILALTFPAVLRRQGISQPGHATMPEFLGTAREP